MIGVGKARTLGGDDEMRIAVCHRLSCRVKALGRVDAAMIVEMILGACGGGLALQSSAALQAIGQNFLASAGQGVVGSVVAKFVPHQNGDLRRLIVASLAQAAKGGVPATPLGQAWRAIERGAETIIPDEKSSGFAPIANAVIAGDESTIGAALAERLQFAPGFPTLGEDELGDLQKIIGPAFRAACAELMKTEQHELGFKAFLRDSLWLLQHKTPGLEPADLEKLREHLEMPNLTPVLERIAADSRQALIVVQQTYGVVVGIDLELEVVSRTLSELNNRFLEAEANNRRTVVEKDQQIEFLRIDAERQRVAAEDLISDKRRDNRTIELLQRQVEQIEIRQAHIAFLEERSVAERRQIEEARAERDALLAQLAQSEPDELRRRAFQVEIENGAEAAEQVLLQARAEYDLDRVELWLRAGDLDRAAAIWMPLAEASVASASVLGVGNDLIHAVHVAGWYRDGVPLAERHLNLATETLGPEHPGTLGSANNLAALYKSAGRLAEAEPLLLATLEASRRVLGPEHPQTLRSASNLVILWIGTGRFEQASALFREALPLARKLPPGHEVRKIYEQGARYFGLE